MKLAHTIVAMTLVALASTACTQTVVRHRNVPIYELRPVPQRSVVAGAAVATEPSARPKMRKVRVGTHKETVKAKKFSWKRTGVGLIVAPVVVVAHILASLG